MSFSNEWEETYAAGGHQSVWPWSDVVSLVRRHLPHLAPGDRVLELGCGVGANIPFFRSLGVAYHAMEGSGTAIAALRQRYPDLADDLIVGDFTLGVPFAGSFALVLDRAALTHNTTARIRASLESARQRIGPQGKFIGVDWFSTRHSEYARGEPDADDFTRRGYAAGPFAGIGRVHFSSAAHLADLFAGYRIQALDHKTIERVIPDGIDMLASWNLVATVEQ